MLAIPQMPVIPAQAAEKTVITEDVLAANDNILYLVNCGTTDAKAVADGYKMGLCQSGTDQRMGEDASVVHIYNSQYITVQNLEVTNWESDAADLMGEKNDKVIYDQSKYLLTGILVENHDAGNLGGVTLKNNYVHDVNGYMQGGADKGSGGIIVLVTGGDVQSYFTDLRITGNKVEKVSHGAQSCHKECQRELELQPS